MAKKTTTSKKPAIPKVIKRAKSAARKAGRPHVYRDKKDKEQQIDHKYEEAKYTHQQPQQPQQDSSKSAEENSTILQEVVCLSPHFFNTFLRLNQATPRDRNGFPSHLYDYNHIPHDLDQVPPSEQAGQLKAAKIPLCLQDGVLSLQDTSNFSPVWVQLPHEPIAYFEAFKDYCRAPNRSLFVLLERIKNAEQHGLPAPNNLTSMALKEAYVLFYWQERARAYDILLPVAANRTRDQRLLLMEDQHYELSNNLMTGLLAELTERGKDPATPGRPFAGMKISELFNSIVASTELQRVSLGLPGKGPRTKDEDNSARKPAFAGADRSLEVAADAYELRDVNNSNKKDVGDAEDTKKRIDAVIARDPEAAERLQNAAIELYTKARTRNDNDDDYTKTNNDRTANTTERSSERSTDSPGDVATEEVPPEEGW